MSQLKEIHRLLEDREKQIIENVSRLAGDMARRELALLEFELFYETIIPQEGKRKAELSVQKIRQERWANALKKAKGNEEEAMFIYDAS